MDSKVVRVNGDVIRVIEIGRELFKKKYGIRVSVSKILYTMVYDDMFRDEVKGILFRRGAI